MTAFETTLFGVYGRLEANAGERETLVALLSEAATLLNSEDGCLLYIVNRSNDNAHDVWVTELWLDEQRHAASLERDDVRSVIGRARPLIADMSQIRLSPAAGIGLPTPERPGDNARLITGTDFVTLPITNFERAVAFYGDALGLPRIT